MCVGGTISIENCLLFVGASALGVPENFQAMFDVESEAGVTPNNPTTEMLTTKLKVGVSTLL